MSEPIELCMEKFCEKPGTEDMRRFKLCLEHFDKLVCGNPLALKTPPSERTTPTGDRP